MPRGSFSPSPQRQTMRTCLSTAREPIITNCGHRRSFGCCTLCPSMSLSSLFGVPHSMLSGFCSLPRLLVVTPPHDDDDASLCLAAHTLQEPFQEQQHRPD
jgi:hypothetical protein